MWCVWQVLGNTSRTKRPGNTKIRRKVAHPTCNNVYQFQGQRSKVKGQRSKAKVTKPTNAETESVSYLPNGKAYELQTWYTDGVLKPVSPTSAVTSKITGQGRKARKVTWCVWKVLADTPRTKRSRNTTIGRKVAHFTGNNAYQFKVKYQRSSSPGRLMMKQNVVSSEGKGLRTSILVHRWSTTIRVTDNRHDLQGQRSRLQDHMVRLTGVGP